jgi:hypothetical protein
MSGELTPMPLPDILAAVGYKTAVGDWPPGFDVPHAMLTLINITERLRLSIAAHHEHDQRLAAEYDYPAPGGPCPVCVQAQGAHPDDVLDEESDGKGDPRDLVCDCGGGHSAFVDDDSPGAGHAVTCPVRRAYPYTPKKHL